MPEIKRFSLVKPTLQTKFHIDFDWWQQNDRDWHIFLSGLLCSDHKAVFDKMNTSQMVDWVDPYTAEVQRVDGIQHMLITHCAKQRDFITIHTSMVDAVFRVFLANGNTPMTPVELSEQLSRPAETILRTFGGVGRVYRGVRPCPEC
jgi:hypothetical protein